MKRRLQVLGVCAAALLAVRMMAQDNSGGAMGGGAASGASGDSSGSTGPDNTSPDNTGAGTNGSPSGGNSMPSGGTGGQNGGGNGTTTPATGDLFAPAPEGTGESSTILPAPAPSAPPAEAAPVPGTTPSPTPAASAAPNAAGTRGAAQAAAPVTFTLPGGYGGSASQSFTLGQGRLAKPPITFSVTVSQGYDDNVFSADAHPVATPTPVPQPTPPLEARLVGFRITVPSPPTPIFQTFRPKASPTPSVPKTTPLGVLGSTVSTLSLGVQIQKGTPRTVLTLDASLGLQDYWQEPGGQIDYTGSFDTSFVHRLTPRATLTINMSAVYQKTPNFALINAPTNNANNSNYLNGTGKVDLSYTWSPRISTVTSYSLDANLLQTNAMNNLYESTYGTQFRYTVSARNTVTAELRETEGDYPSNPTANSSSTFYLLGLDSFFSTRLRNTISGGLESHSFSSSGSSRILPYFESATTLGLPRGASLVWTNRYGSEESQSATQSVTSYRSTLSFSQPLSTKLVASASVTYNYLEATDSSDPTQAYTQKQFEAALSLGYTLSPRLSLSLSYTYLDFLATQVNSSYQRDQVFLGGSYTFQ